MNDTRKKKIPGIHDNIKAIATYKDEITQIYENITLYKSKIQSEHALQKEKSGRAVLFDTKEAISEEIKALYEKRDYENSLKSTLIAELNTLRATMKGQKTVNIVDIEKKQKEIEHRMIAERYTAQQEKELQAQLLELKKKKSLVGDSQDKERKVNDLEGELQKVKKRLENINEELFTRKKEMEELKQEIENVKEKEKSKSDAVVCYEEKIDELKKRRDELLEKKKKEHDEIKRKEDEYDAFMAEMAAQMEIENKKKEQKNKIKKMIEQLNVLEEQKNNCDPSKYDGMIEAVKKLKDVKNIPIVVIQKLSSEKLGIPKNQEDIKNIIEALEKRKEKFGSEIGNKLGTYSDNIKNLSAEIDEEKKKLAAMPATDVRIERERKFNNN
ncbi:hypothetical protein COBT_002571 [Conglomerata obtusa]